MQLSRLSHAVGFKQICLLFCLAGQICVLSRAPTLAQDVAPALDFEARVDLARQMLEPVRESVLAGEKSRQIIPAFLQQYALIDPLWTANYILENPPPDDGVLYDHNAIREIMSRATDIPEDVLFQLLKGASFMRADYAVLALKNIPEQHTELRERIIATGLDRSDDEFGVNPMEFESLLKLAGYSQDATLKQEVQRKIDDFYESGKAQKLKQSLEPGTSNTSFYDALLKRFAPGAVAAPMDTGAGSVWNISQEIIRNDRLSDEEKRKRLRAIKSFSYGTQPYELASAASLLGSVALLDTELAIKWADEAPQKVLEVWAKLLIAPSVAKHDRGQATAMVRQAYDDLLEIDPDVPNFFYYNYSPLIIASRGLHLVEVTDAALMNECVVKTRQLADRFLTHNTRGQYYIAIVGIAPYAPDEARAMFDEISAEVSIADAQNFFRALLAVRPDEVWEEYQQMPVKDRGSNDVRSMVLGAIVPALAQENPRDFWSKLGQQLSLDVDAAILANDES